MLLIGPIIDPLLVDDYPRWLEKAYSIFQEMVEGGNEVARFRWSELQQLDATLHAISQNETGNPTQKTLSRQSGAIPQLRLTATGYLPASIDRSSSRDDPFITENTLDVGDVGCGLGPMLSSAEIIAMADSIEMYDAEWVSSAIIDHNIW